MNNRLYDKLQITQNEMIVFANNFVEKFRKSLFYPVIIFCVFLSFMIIKYDNTGIFKYLIIPFSILVIICLKHHIKQHEHLLKTYKLKVDKNSVSFYSESKLIEIFIKQIISIEDKSFYYDFNGNGPYNKGWHHTFKMKISNGKEFINNIKGKALLVCKYLEDDNTVELQIDTLNLKHEDYLKLIEYIKSYIK